MTMDLFGKNLKAWRACQVLIVLRRETPWAADETARLANELKPMAIVGCHPQHPGVIIVSGDYTQEQLQDCLGNKAFEMERIEGLDNPKLPFPAPTL